VLKDSCKAVGAAFMNSWFFDEKTSSDVPKWKSFYVYYSVMLHNRYQCSDSPSSSVFKGKCTSSAGNGCTISICNPSDQ
jgi:hypothetical protein